MTEMADVIISFLFLPVTLFIILPLTMLCGYLLFKMTLPLWTPREETEKDEVEDVVQITETS